MTERSRVIEMETMFMALADRTRLRLLNLMADGEVCVNLFTEALGESQPKVSRHLAYLRNAGLVDTRRHGKWIYYSVRRQNNDASDSVFNATLSALADDSELRSDRARLFGLSTDRARSSTDRATSISPPSPIPHHYEHIRPIRPVHNELDEFLL